MQLPLTLTCRRCLSVKPFAVFTKDSRKPFGRRNICRECERVRIEAWHTAHPERRRQYAARSRAAHKQEYLALSNAWRERNRDRVAAKAKERYRANPEKFRLASRLSRLRRPETVLRQNREHRKEHPEYARLYMRARRASDTSFRILQAMRKRVHRAIGQGSIRARTRELIGCSLEQLKAHLESRFTPAMTWGNYGTFGWHIDHIKPCASFDLSDPDEQRRCFHYTNLQPLWCTDNWSKGGRVSQRKDG